MFPLFVVLFGAAASHVLVAATDPESDVTVREERGVYSVIARFDIPHPPSVAFAVLTDYERIPRFMPGVVSSSVWERSPGRVLVEQEAVSQMLMFSKRVHLLLEVHEAPEHIRFRDVAGRSFSSYEGAWRLTQEDGRTVVSYELRADPSFEVPEFLLKRLLRRDARRMIERLRGEMTARDYQARTLDVRR
jgi:ribosome-associated toxin RatA of RatAB toxin-antitoxin module